MRWFPLVLLALVTTACPAVEVETPAPQVEGEATVPLDVVEGPGEGTLAFVPVTIRGEGPFPFALDTGASHSLVDAELADELGLERVDEAAPPVAGVVGVAEAELVQIDDWAIGDVELEPRSALVLELTPAETAPFAGLLGSDVLSGFGAVTVDYDRGELVLRPHS
jgi:hypothetical protein